jgi:hypothetical protein
MPEKIKGSGISGDFFKFFQNYPRRNSYSNQMEFKGVVYLRFKLKKKSSNTTRMNLKNSSSDK